MSALGWVLLSISVLGCMWGWRWIMRAQIADTGSCIDGGPLFAMSFLSLTLCWAWPAIVIFTLIRAPLGRVDPQKLALRIAGTPKRKSRRWTDAELERIERELGIIQDDPNEAARRSGSMSPNDVRRFTQPHTGLGVIGPHGNPSKYPPGYDPMTYGVYLAKRRKR